MPVLEFGLRRAQSWAATAGARAALIGGADFTSNVAASHALGFSPKGTHAHSMIQVYLGLGREEIDAFRAFARLYPDTLTGRFLYGVGTHLITSTGAPALKAAYKLVAVHDRRKWQPTVKLSESAEKTPTPGAKALWRLVDQRGMAAADVVATPDEDPGAAAELTLCHPTDPYRCRTISKPQISRAERLQQVILKAGRRVIPAASIQESRQARDHDLAQLDAGVKRLVNPHRYHVSLTAQMWERKNRLVETMTADT